MNQYLNSLMVGDSLIKLKQIPTESVDMIYLDPPFFTQSKQKLKTRDNSKEYFFDDKWESIEGYRQYIQDRLVECHRVLKKTGSIFLHCDKNASHHLRIALDNVFSQTNFRSEIIWNYKRWSNSKKGLLNNHQTIYFYSKTKEFKFNTIYTDYSVTTNIDQILQDREKNEHGKSVYKKDKHGNIKLGKGKKGVPLSDVWELPYLNPKAKERVGYPTQKPIILLEQIIKITTEQGDIVLDPFVGSGTTVVASKLLKRNYIGIDKSEEAIKLARSRLDNPIKTDSHLLKKGKEKYKNLSDEKMELIKELGGVPVQRNKGIDGFLKENFKDLPVSIRIQREDENIYEACSKLLKYSKTKKCSAMILIRTHIDTIKTVVELDYPKNMFIIDKYDLAVKKIIQSEIKQTDLSNNK